MRFEAEYAYGNGIAGVFREFASSILARGGGWKSACFAAR